MIINVNEIVKRRQIKGARFYEPITSLILFALFAVIVTTCFPPPRWIDSLSLFPYIPPPSSSSSSSRSSRRGSRRTQRSFKSGAEMERRLAAIVVLCILWNLHPVLCLRFVIDREECFTKDVPYAGDTVQVSFVVIKIESWRFSDDGVDLVVKGPTGEQIRDSRGKSSDMFDFTVHRKGIHHFCFVNKSPYHETIDFDIHVAHFAYHEEHAKDEHFASVAEQIKKLEIALHSIQFEQHWLDAQTDRQIIVNEAMGRRAIMKALFESAALVGVSTLQVYLLRRLFQRKLGKSRF